MTWVHPETGDREVFLSNANQASYQVWDFKTKRRGIRAYDGNGRPLVSRDDLFPVFIAEKEILERGGDLKAIRQALIRR